MKLPKWGVLDSSKLKRIIPFGLSVIAIAVFVAYLIRNFDRYEQLLDLSVNSALLLVVLVFATIYVNGLVNYALYHGLGATNMPVGEAIGLATVNTLANQLPFAGGMVAKAVYMKRRYRISYSQFVSATVAVFVLSIGIEGVMGLVGILYLVTIRGYPSSTWLVVGFALMAASTLSLWLPLDFLPMPERWEKQVTKLKEGWQTLRNNPALLLTLIGTNVAGVLVSAARALVVFRALSQDVNLVQSILFASASILTQLVSITPGGLGLKEGIIAIVASVYGIDFGVSIVAVGIDRLVSTSIIVVLGTIYTYILSKRAANETPFKEMED